MIHNTAIIEPGARIGNNVKIGPFAYIHKNVIIGDNAEIGSYSELGIPTGLAKDSDLLIGSNSIIRSHSVLYQGSRIGSYFRTGHYVTVRENSQIGEHVQLGSRTDVQGDCIIGRYTKCHADVHIGKLSNVGNYVWLFPEVLLTNDPTPPSEELLGVTINDFTVVASKVLLMPGVTIGRDCLVGAASLIKENVPDSKVVTGNPAKVICDVNILRHHSNPKQKAYPWRRRFHRGYSESDIQSWIEEFS
ncbi:N-acetyltransferase [Kistimonas scapharcae]|uniref:N-acetyltransferase n=1 Tax=Kistimonas scapharcae TaxID=1036133 RepID=A0ABP8V996_9GAMM